MSSDISAVTLTTTGTARAGRCRVMQLVFVCEGTGGSIVLRDGGATGDVLLDLATPTAAGFHSVEFPCDGILFETDCYATLTDVSSLTVVYEG